MHLWDIDETRTLVERLHGRSQLERARPALRSVADRLSYARIHIQALEVAIKTYLSTERREKELMEIIFTDSGDAWHDFNLFLREVGAHATAAIQSLHAVGDLFSHAIYYSCAVGATNPIDERKISVSTVVSRLNGNTKATNLCALLASFGAQGDFQHVAALSNRAKHRSIVLPSLSEDHTGERPERLAVLIQAFDHDDTHFPAVAAQTFLVSQFEAVGRRANEVGNELNTLLRRSAA